MSSKRKTALGALLLGLCIAAPAVALMIQWPLEDMVRDSQSIVLGHVVDLESHWLDGPQSTIVTDVAFQVDETWKGSRGGKPRLSLRVVGGEVDGIGMVQEHQPVFARGEEAVLFLWAMPGGGGRLSVYNDEQGRYAVVGDKAVSFKQEKTLLTAFRAAVDRAMRLGRR